MLFLDVLLQTLIHAVADILPLDGPGHLALFGRVAPGATEAVMLAVAAQGGIAAALVCYFWRDMAAMAVGIVRFPKRRIDPGGRLFLLLVVGNIPAIGLLFLFPGLMQVSPPVLVTAGMLALFGLLLLLADHLGVTVHRVEHLGWGQVAVIGALQAVSVIPGIGRVALSVMAARFLGYERHHAARLALLLSIPLLLAQMLMVTSVLASRVELRFSSDMLLVAGITFGVALVTVAALMGWVGRRTFRPFAWWRIVVGSGAVALLLIFG